MCEEELRSFVLPDESAYELLSRTVTEPIPSGVFFLGSLRAGQVLELAGASGTAKSEVLVQVICPPRCTLRTFAARSIAPPCWITDVRSGYRRFLCASDCCTNCSPCTSKRHCRQALLKGDPAPLRCWYQCNRYDIWAAIEPRCQYREFVVHRERASDRSRCQIRPAATHSGMLPASVAPLK